MNYLLLAVIVTILIYIYTTSNNIENYSQVIQKNFYLPDRRSSLIWEMGNLVDVPKHKHVTFNRDGTIHSVTNHAPVSNTKEHWVLSRCPPKLSPYCQGRNIMCYYRF